MKHIFLLLLITLAVAQDASQEQIDLSPPTEPSLSEAQKIRVKENQIRSQNNMSYINIRSYTFVCGRFDDFILKPDVDYDIQFELHVYWRQQNVYITADYKEGQQIRVIVYEDNNRVILDREFYIVTGFTFLGRKGSSYTVRFLAAGRVAKLVSMLTSSQIPISGDKATKQHLQNAQSRVQKVNNELKALLTISQRNYFMKDQIAGKVLSSSKIYMSYQIFEMILIIGVAVVQVGSLTKLLKGSSIV